MNQEKSTAAQIENVRRQWEELDYQSKVALSLHFNDKLEKLEESMASQSSSDSPSRPTQEEKPQKKEDQEGQQDNKTCLPSAPPQGHLEELTNSNRQEQRAPGTNPEASRRDDFHSYQKTKGCRLFQRRRRLHLHPKKKRKGEAPALPRSGDPLRNLLRRPLRKTIEKRTRPTRIPPLVIEGPLVDKMASPTELRKVIKIPERIRVTKTKARTYLLHCRTEDDRLEALTHGSKHTSFYVRPTKRTTEEHLTTALKVIVTHIRTEDIRRKGNERFQRPKTTGTSTKSRLPPTMKERGTTC